MSQTAAAGGKQYSVVFYFKDWDVDPALRGASPTVRDRWFAALRCMWHEGKASRTDTMAGWASYWGCTLKEAREAIDHIRSRRIANVTLRNGSVTLLCRRLLRERKEREKTRRRVQKHREHAEGCNGPVTRPMLNDVDVDVNSRSLKRCINHSPVKKTGEHGREIGKARGNVRTAHDWGVSWKRMVTWIAERKPTELGRWTAALMAKRELLEKSNPSIVLGHLIDVWYGRKAKAGSVEQAVGWVAWRTKSLKVPSDRHLAEAMRFLGQRS